MMLGSSTIMPLWSSTSLSCLTPSLSSLLKVSGWSETTCNSTSRSSDNMSRSTRTCSGQAVGSREIGHHLVQPLWTLVPCSSCLLNLQWQLMTSKSTTLTLLIRTRCKWWVAPIKALSTSQAQACQVQIRHLRGLSSQCRLTSRRSTSHLVEEVSISATVSWRPNSIMDSSKIYFILPLVSFLRRSQVRSIVPMLMPTTVSRMLIRKVSLLCGSRQSLIKGTRTRRRTRRWIWTVNWPSTMWS